LEPALLVPGTTLFIIGEVFGGVQAETLLGGHCGEGAAGGLATQGHGHAGGGVGPGGGGGAGDFPGAAPATARASECMVLVARVGRVARGLDPALLMRALAVHRAHLGALV
jgi:hypothetical protein